MPCAPLGPQAAPFSGIPLPSPHLDSQPRRPAFFAHLGCAALAARRRLGGGRVRGAAAAVGRRGGARLRMRRGPIKRKPELTQTAVAG